MTSPAPTVFYQDAATTLIHGRYQDAVAAGMVPHVDAVITDPPYSERTHAGHNSGTRAASAHDASYGHRQNTRPIGYASWSEAEVAELVQATARLGAAWLVALTDDVSIRWYRQALSDAGLVCFAAVPVVEIGSRVRMTGDGPSSWSHYLCAGRRRSKALAGWGTLPGAYIFTGHGDRVITGGKRVDAMRSIVADYTREGDLVLDPCAGGGTTGVACRLLKRRSILIEQDATTCEIAARRLSTTVPETGRQLALGV